MEYDSAFTAFISYRHKPLDAYVASLLHKGLEHYRVPGSIAQKTGKKRLGRMFRDNEELPITSDLTSSIMDALDRSTFLIVVCTPDAPKSPWVLREIEYFLKHHPQNNILTVLAAGVPDESFPALLTTRQQDGVNGELAGEPVEPLAADVRASTRAETKRKLKKEITRLAAAILNCPYDMLCQRERVYRNRIKAGIAAVTVVTLSTFIAMLLIKNANIQRNLRSAQINQSRYLSDVSARLFESGDRLAAIQVAIAALPDETQDRPFVPEAEYALSNALLAYGRGANMYPAMALKTDANIGKIALNQDGSRALILDDNCNIYCFDTATGARLWKKPFAYYAEKSDAFLSICNVHALSAPAAFLVSNGNDIICLSEADGAPIWQYTSEADSVRFCAISENKRLCVISENNFGDTAFCLRTLDTATGKAIGSVSVEGAVDTITASKAYAQGAFSSDGRYYVSAWRTDGQPAASETDRFQLVELDFQTGTATTIKSDLPEVLAVSYLPGRDIALICVEQGADEFEMDTVYVERIRLQTHQSVWSSTYRAFDTHANLSSVQYMSNASGQQLLLCNSGYDMASLSYDEGEILYTEALPGGVSSAARNASDYCCILNNGELYFMDPFIPVGFVETLNGYLVDSTLNVDCGKFVAAPRSEPYAVIYQFAENPRDMQVVARRWDGFLCAAYCRQWQTVVLFERDYQSGITKAHTLDPDTLEETGSPIELSRGFSRYLGGIPSGNGFAYADADGVPVIWDNGESGFPVPDFVDADIRCEIVGKPDDYRIVRLDHHPYAVSPEARQTEASLQLINPYDGARTDFTLPGVLSEPKNLSWGGNGYLACNIRQENDVSQVCFLDPLSGQRHTLPMDAWDEDAVCALADTEDLYAVWCADQRIRVYRISSGDCVYKSAPEDVEILWLRFAMDDRYLICATSQNQLLRVDLKHPAAADMVAVNEIIAFDASRDAFELIDENRKMLLYSNGRGFLIDWDSFAMQAYIPSLQLFLAQQNKLILSYDSMLGTMPLYTTRQLIEWGKDEVRMQPLTDRERQGYYLDVP